MRFFIDTCDIDAIQHYADLGIIDGVTSNWALAEKTGTTVGLFLRRLIDCEFDRKLEVSFQPKTTGHKYAEGTLALYDLYKDRNEHIELVPKVPVYGVYIKAGFEIATKAPINATMVLEPWQVEVANKMGAKYVSLFVSRILNQYIDTEKAEQAVDSLVDLKKGCNVIFASLKTTDQVNALIRNYGWYAAEELVLTIPPAVLEQMIQSPSVGQIFTDWRNPPRQRNLLKQIRAYLAEF